MIGRMTYRQSKIDIDLSRSGIKLYYAELMLTYCEMFYKWGWQIVSPHALKFDYMIIHFYRDCLPFSHFRLGNWVDGIFDSLLKCQLSLFHEKFPKRTNSFDECFWGAYLIGMCHWYIVFWETISYSFWPSFFVQSEVDLWRFQVESHGIPMKEENWPVSNAHMVQNCVLVKPCRL